MRRISFLILFFTFIAWAPTPELSADQPNVLLISIDDLNDWVGCLSGHPQAKTPNMDRLAKMGTLFENAHCQSPVCNPSRASMMTGRYPHTTGIYFLSPDLKKAPVLKGVKTIPEVFAANGYKYYKRLVWRVCVNWFQSAGLDAARIRRGLFLLRIEFGEKAFNLEIDV